MAVAISGAGRVLHMDKNDIEVLSNIIAKNQFHVDYR